MNAHQDRIGSVVVISLLVAIVSALALLALPATARAQTRVPPLPTRLAPLRVTPAPQATPATPQMPCVHLTTDGAPGSSFVGGRVKERCFAFPGDAGATVSFVLKSATAGAIPAMELRGPDGNVVARSNKGEIKEQVLPMDGPYAVIVSGANLAKATRVEASAVVTGGATGPSHFSPLGLDSSEAPALLCSGVVQLGKTRTDIVPFPGQDCRFTFTARRGQAINVWMESQNSSLQPEITLLDPAGNVLDNGHAIDDRTRYASAISLPADGVYTVIAGSQGSQSAGAFELTVHEGASIACGDALSLGVLTEVQLPAGGRPCDVTLDVPYSNWLSFEVLPLDATAPPAWQIVGPEGTVVSSSNDVITSWHAEQIGRYSVRLSSSSRQPQRVLVQVTPPTAYYIYIPTCGGALSSGPATSAKTQSIAIAGASCLFTFDGRAGDMIWLAVSVTAYDAGFAPLVELMAPDFHPSDAPEATGDDSVFTGMVVIRDHTLAQTGRYTARVSDYGNDDTGGFYIRLWKR